MLSPFKPGGQNGAETATEARWQRLGVDVPSFIGQPHAATVTRLVGSGSHVPAAEAVCPGSNATSCMRGTTAPTEKICGRPVAWPRPIARTTPAKSGGNVWRGQFARRKFWKGFRPMPSVDDCAGGEPEFAGSTTGCGSFEAAILRRIGSVRPQGAGRERRRRKNKRLFRICAAPIIPRGQGQRSLRTLSAKPKILFVCGSHNGTDPDLARLGEEYEIVPVRSPLRCAGPADPR